MLICVKKKKYMRFTMFSYIIRTFHTKAHTQTHPHSCATDRKLKNFLKEKKNRKKKC